MQGRVMLFQEHPFECQTNYAGASSLRCNFDVQDLRRVLPESRWMREDDQMPHLGPRDHFGYMRRWEWNGSEYEDRGAQGDTEPLLRDDELRPEDWRAVLLDILDSRPNDDENEHDDDSEEIMTEAQGAFSDGINTGFYINAYTTKVCPTMGGVLEQLRQGIERLDQQHVLRRDQFSAKALSPQTSPKGVEAPAANAKEGAAKSPLAETLETLCRLSSSYRRCYWKSGSEMLFPIMFGHLTFASHRCWTVYVKKAIFLSAEAWRRQYGQSVYHAAKKDGGGAVIMFVREGLEPFALVGWRRIEIDDLVLYEGSKGERCDSLAQAFDSVMARVQTRARR